MIGNPLLLGDEGYQIQRSLRFRSSASAYLARTPAVAGNQTTWTWSSWVKRGALGVESEFLNCYNASQNKTAYFRWNSDNTLTFFDYDAIGGVFINRITTTQVLRDPSAYYHIVLVYNTGNATASERLRFYINGVRVTSLSIAAYPSLNYAGVLNTAAVTNIGKYSAGASGYFDGYMAEVNFIDGQALTPSSFGEYSLYNQWLPKKYAGTYGTNGFYLPFTDNSAATATAIGADKSGNGNNWTPNNISLTAGATYDSMLDVPLGAGGGERGNYAVVNTLDKAANIAVAQGNLSVSNSGGGSWASVRGSMSVSSGKWYWEIDETYSSGGPLIMGIADAAFNPSTQRAGDTAGSYVLAIDGNKGNNGTFSSYVGGSIASGRNIGVALDLDAGTLIFYNNGVSLGTAYSSISGTFSPAISIYGTQGGTANFNFGQRPFAYTPPTGFKALHTGNLPDAVIKLPAQYMAATLYTGNGSTQSIVNTVNGVGMQPDFVWLKSRSGAFSNVLQNTVAGITNYLSSDLTSAEGNGGANTVTSVNSNGFSLGSGSSWNNNASTFVGWQWKAGGTAVSNTAGSITSQVSAGVSQGFSVVTYTGTGANATVGHGLGVAPKMVIVKARSNSTYSWSTYHASIGAGALVWLNLTNASTASTAVWNNTSPAASVFSLGADLGVNQSGQTYVAYCFSEVTGYSKFGSYTGNGSADGPFVYLGFRPRFVMIKSTSAGRNWVVFDSSRNLTNIATALARLKPNTSAAEDANEKIDFLSNGFKQREFTYDGNASGETYIYACFAENPFKYANAR